MNHLRCIAASMLLLFTAPTTTLAQDLQSLGQDLPALIQECESCHGPKGVSTDVDIPSLAGLSAQHIQQAMDQFYFYERHCPTTTYRHGEHESSPPLNMCSIASGLGDEEVLALAEYFAAPPAVSE
jgi:cytochrome subunit of sulfide dehydrogenase